MLRGIIYIFIIIYLISAAVGMVGFFIDIVKWHFKEEKEDIIPSAVFNESEVNADERGNNGDRGNNDRICDRGNDGTGNDNYDISDVFRNLNSDSNS
ncbi:hypothetical protein [Ruminococcus sp.]|uniref:hypothetical protein n=1 Tax=Ruminococcus sp. TaxID=41978 RepID=UPI0025E0F7EE|nr:hypothetical protein [Ruminococcus sp.]MCR4640168.1 hypothetical protein [Ruminococcus sp.]